MNCESSSENLELEQAESKKRRRERKRAKMLLLEASCSKPQFTEELDINEPVTKIRQNRRKHRSRHSSNAEKGTLINSSTVNIPTDLNNSHLNLKFTNLIIKEQSSNQCNLDISNDEKSQNINKSVVKNVNNSKSSSMNNKIKTPKLNNVRENNKIRRDDLDQSTSFSNDKFLNYIPEDEVNKGLAESKLFNGYLRINPKDYKLAYISNPIKTEQDFLIISIKDRNGALDGDHVVVKLKPQKEWKTSNQKTASVVYIVEKIHPRTTVGTLKLMPDRNKRHAIFVPRDSRVPRIKIPFTDWPDRFFDLAEDYENVLFSGKIVRWFEPKYAIGTILENIGMSGDIRSETKAILAEYSLNTDPYSNDITRFLPRTGEISTEEYKNRVDLRKECIFTIDPATARDLDDAVSCKQLSNGNFEVGVHISDVTYYLKDDTPLDKKVAQKATSVYMVESVYHMLPKELCMICSLLPGEDKLAVSVFWEMTPEGQIIRHKFARTIINSCVQLSYDHAQSMIDNPNKDFVRDELPTIYNGFKQNDILRTVNILQKLSVILRQSRFNSGALRIDQPKVQFSLDLVTCLPLSYTLYENKESHRLIEEFMLLANITVASTLSNDFPNIAFLRKHPAPNEYMMLKLKTFLEEIGIHLDITTAGGLHKSLLKYSADDSLSQARMTVLNLLCAKPMNRANYFCANNDPSTFWHYALNIPLYTHFTSPIRRYADIMVHRQLTASLGYREKPNWSSQYVESIAENCNIQKLNAKRAGEQSIELYLIHYIALHQPVFEKAVVMDLKDNSFDAIILSNGLNVRVYFNTLDEGVGFHYLNEKLPSMLPEESKKHLNLTIEWPAKDGIPAKKEIVSIFSVITISLSKKDKLLKLETKLIRPDI